MKRAIREIGRSLGLEGALLMAGTACLAVAAAIVFGAAGPWAVVGGVLVILGFAVALKGAA